MFLHATTCKLYFYPLAINEFFKDDFERRRFKYINRINLANYCLFIKICEIFKLVLVAVNISTFVQGDLMFKRLVSS